MSAKRYFVIEQRGLPIDVSASWSRANELAIQYGTKEAPTTIVEVEARQQELPLTPYCHEGCGCG